MGREYRRIVRFSVIILVSALVTLGCFIYEGISNRHTVTPAAAETTPGSTGPAVSEITPPPGSVSESASPGFRLRFYDSDELDPGVIVKVDNQTVTPTISWAGIYTTEIDTCTGEPYDVWVGNDYTGGVVTAQFPRLSGGLHTVFYSLKDRLGNMTESSYTFTVSDTRSPVVSGKSPVDLSVTANPKPVIKAKITDTNGIDTGKVYMKLNGTSVAAPFDPIRSEISYTVPQVLKNGTYQVEVGAADVFGNSCVSSWSFSVNETTPPAITNLVPANGGVTSNTKPAIEASISDVSGITNPVSLQIDGARLEVQYQPATGKVSYVCPTALADGEHTVILSVNDFQGNQATATWKFTVYSQGPYVTNLSPAPGAVLDKSPSSFSLRFNTDNKLDPNVVVKVDNLNVTPTITWDGIYVTEYDSCSDTYYDVRTGDDYTKGVVSAPLPSLGGGQHTIYYCLKDRTGLVTEKSYVITITDTGGPQITEMTPANGTTVTDPKPVIKAKIMDSSGVATSQLVMKLNGSPVAAAYDLASSTISYAVPAPLKNATYQVQVVAPDILGNTTSVLWSFTVKESTPPVISNLVPANNSIIGSTKPLIEATLSDSSGIVNPVYLQLDTQNIETTYSIQTGKVSYVPANTLGQGKHNVAMTVYDFQGNKAAASWSFTISANSGPVVSGILPAPGGVIPSLRPTFTLRFEDPDKVDSAGVVKIDGRSVTSSVNFDGIYQTDYDSCTGEYYEVLVGYDYTKGTLTANLSQLSSGKHAVYYCIKDTLGNMTEGTYDFTISDTSGPEAVDKSPADGATVAVGKPLITARLSEPNLIVAASVNMTVNGELVSSTYDQTSRTVKYQPVQALKGGQNIVQVSATDELGNIGQTSWKFYISDITAPKITLQTPSPNAVTGEFSPVISAKITDESGVDPTRVVLKLNGETVGAFNTATGVVSYKPAYSLAEGTYAVDLSVYDVYNNTTTVQWSFNVKDSGAPQISSLLPPPSSGTRSTKPKISASVSDAGGLDVSRSSITVDGASMSVTFVPDRPGSVVGGTVSAVPAADLSNAMHTVVVKVFDKAGNSQEKSWRFGVNTFEEMSTGAIGDCLVCHTEGIASLEKRHVAGSGDCGLCHGRGLGGSSDCGDCHGGHSEYWPPAIGSHSCTECHNSLYWNVVPTHGGPNMVTPPHNYGAMDQQCLACHFSSLTKEHNVYVESRGVGYNCSTCHLSSDPQVKAAITGHDTSCTTCHGDKANHELFHKTTLEANCLKCHTDNLTSEHIRNRPEKGFNCDTCHQSGDSKVAEAINQNNKSCVACHGDTGSHYALHANGLDSSCATCHSDNLISDHIDNRPDAGLNCETCHPGNTNPSNRLCSECHAEGHGIGLAKGAPSDIPLYSGVEWSEPINASIFAGESWLNAVETSGLKLLVSRRYPDINGDSVWNFYKVEMALKGWTMDSTAPPEGSDFFVVTFSKSSRKVTVRFYGGGNHNSSPVVEAGYRIEILYN